MRITSIFLLFIGISNFLFGEQNRSYHTQHIEIIIDEKSNLYCFDYSYSKTENNRFKDFELEGFYSEKAKFDLPQKVKGHLIESYRAERNYSKSIKDTISFSSGIKYNFNHWIKVKDINFDNKEDIGVYWAQASGSAGLFYNYYVQLKNELVHWKGAPMNFMSPDSVQKTFVTYDKGGGGKYILSKYQIRQDTVLQLIRSWNTFKDNLKTGNFIMYDSILIDTEWEVRIDSNFMWEDDMDTRGYFN